MQKALTTMFFLMAISAGSLVALASSSPILGEPVLVVSSRGPEARAEIVSKSGGRLIGLRSGIFASLAISNRPDFASNLTKFGSVLVLDGRRLSDLCEGGT